MGNQTYVLDWLVTGADQVSVFDDGTGTDKIVVRGIYTGVCEINLGYATNNGQSFRAGASYVGADVRTHWLYINGLIENAFGSNGSDFMRGNELGNKLSGDVKSGGAGGNDTIWGFGGNDKVHGGAGNDEIHGDEGRDKLFGDAGNDTIEGGTGADTINGGAGADLLSGGGNAGDTLSYLKSPAGVQITLLYGVSTAGFGGDAQGDQIDGFLNVLGSRYGDVMEDGDKGQLAAGGNDNQFYGGNGGDVLTLGGGNDKGYGGKGGDTLWGEAGNDSLYGGTNNDHLRGGLGQDNLTGGDDADVFEYWSTDESSPGAANRDVITDFQSSQGDVISLSRIDADTGRAGNQAFHLVTDGFHGVAAELYTQTTNNGLLVQADTNGDGQADLQILLLNVSSLSASDFIL